MGLRLLSIVAAAVTGATGTAMTAAQFAEGHGRFLDALVSRPYSTAGGAIGGALCGVLAWVLWSPRHRVTKAAAILAGLNAVAWLIVLLASSPVADGGKSILEQRVSLDAGAPGNPHGMTFDEEPVFLVARRVVNWVDLSQKPLGFFAGPAVVFVHEQVVPERYRRTGPTTAESDWIAVVGFVMSTAWWVTAGTVGPRLSAWNFRLRTRRATQT